MLPGQLGPRQWNRRRVDRDQRTTNWPNDRLSNAGAALAGAVGRLRRKREEHDAVVVEVLRLGDSEPGKPTAYEPVEDVSTVRAAGGADSSPQQRAAGMLRRVLDHQLEFDAAAAQHPESEAPLGARRKRVVHDAADERAGDLPNDDLGHGLPGLVQSDPPM